MMIETKCPACNFQHHDQEPLLFHEDGRVLCRQCGESCGDIGKEKAPFGPTTPTYNSRAEELAIKFIASKPVGWCSQAKALQLVRVVEREKPLVCVEIGVFGGASLIPIGLALRENGKGIVTGIDPWRNDCAVEGMNEPANVEWWKNLDIEAAFRSCLAQVHQNNLMRVIELKRAKSEDMAATFADGSIDLLHFDGNHSEEQSLRNVRLYLPKLHAGSHVFFDDVNWTEGGKRTQADAVAMVTAVADKLAEMDDGNCHVYRVGGFKPN